jgi:hypothetical protein
VGKRRKTMKKFISNAFTLVFVFILTWMLVSTIEVVSKNLEPNPTYSDWNCWEIFVDASNTLD